MVRFFNLAAIILASVFVTASTTATDIASTTTTERSGSNLLPLCSPCRYDAQCTSCKCVRHRCVPEKDPHFKCNRPNCAECRLSAACANKSCIRGRCVRSKELYYNCPSTRPYCYPCRFSNTCKTGNCVINKCAINRKDYYQKCPGTRPECATCTGNKQCKDGLICYQRKCVRDKEKYFNCPGTRRRCDRCMGKSFLCADKRKCLSGICARDQNEVDICTKCCFFDQCSKTKKCVRKGSTFLDACRKKIFLYDKKCKRSIYSCCFDDACSGKRKCIKPNGLFNDSCGAQYKIRHDCKLIQTKKEYLCCYSEKCFITGLKIKKKCVKKGGTLRDTCGGIYDVGRDCSLKRKVCCYKVSCAHKTYCKSIGSTIQVPCGRSFKVLANCKVAAVHRQLVLSMFSRKTTRVQDGSDVPSLIPIEDQVELIN